MSSKKKDRSEWVDCLTCNKFFTKASLHRHQKYCQDESGDPTSMNEIASDVEELSYIFDGVFLGKLKEADASDNVLPYFKMDTVLIHPNTLKCANFQIASFVEIISKDTSVICTVWPCSLTNPETVIVPLPKYFSLNHKEGDFVQVKMYSGVAISARVVKFRPLEEVDEDVFDEMKNRLADSIDDCIVTVGETLIISHYAQHYRFSVTNAIKEEELESKFTNLSLSETKLLPRFRVSFENTKFELDSSVQSDLEKNNKGFRDIPGMFSQKGEIEESIVMPLENPLLYKQFGVEPQHGVIFHGQTGTGKSRMAECLRYSIPGIHFTMIDSSEVISQYSGEAEEKIKFLFQLCIQNSPSILVVDDFHVLCPARDSNKPTGELEKRLVPLFANLLDSIPRHAHFLVIAITADVASVHYTLRRSGRFDKEIEFTVPNSKEREEIIRAMLLEAPCHTLSDVHINEIVSLTLGFVAADLKTLFKEACLVGLRTSFTTGNISLTIEAFRNALLRVRPSAMKSLTVDIPKVYWSDVGGQKYVKQTLQESIEWPLKFPDTFKRMGISPPKGLLMYGPPGCSKTLIAKALATESGLNFISIKGPELFNMYLGESERAVRDVFRKARAAAPSIIFFDEIDALSMKRAGGSNNTVGDRVLAQMLTELDGVEGLRGVIIVAATNRPDVIDSALLRPGRIDRMIYVPLPDADTRREIFSIQFRSIPVDGSVSLDTLVKISSGYSGAEICALCREAAISALREDFDSSAIKLSHFINVFDQSKPGTSSELIKFYDEFAQRQAQNRPCKTE